jgi:hypothetical protein
MVKIGQRVTEQEACDQKEERRKKKETAQIQDLSRKTAKVTTEVYTLLLSTKYPVIII